MNSSKEQFNDIMKIIKDNEKSEHGGIVSAKLSIEDFNEIEKIAPNFVDLDMQWNEAPTQREFVDFCRKNPQFAMEVHITNPFERSDIRLAIEGLVSIDTTEESTKALANFIENCSGSAPDEYEADNQLRAWWD